MNYDENRPLCKCGNMCKKSCFSKKYARITYNSYCRSCAKSMHGKKDIRLKTYKKDRCDFCGFIAVHTCQLDVDHIDGNNKNNNPKNLQTLCANCHRLKTKINMDWKDKSPINNESSENETYQNNLF